MRAELVSTLMQVVGTFRDAGLLKGTGVEVGFA